MSGFVCLNLCGQLCICVYMGYSVTVSIGFVLSLTTDWAWGHGAAAASPLSAYWIEKPLKKNSLILAGCVTYLNAFDVHNKLG